MDAHDRDRDDEQREGDHDDVEPARALSALGLFCGDDGDEEDDRREHAAEDEAHRAVVPEVAKEEYRTDRFRAVRGTELRREEHGCGVACLLLLDRAQIVFELREFTRLHVAGELHVVRVARIPRRPRPEGADEILVAEVRRLLFRCAFCEEPRDPGAHCSSSSVRPVLVIVLLFAPALWKAARHSSFVCAMRCIVTGQRSRSMRAYST